jgi:sec-independent protein translocase protein TatA
MFEMGPWEWIIILVIVLILFGPGRIANIAGEIGKSIRSFRDGMKGDNEENPTDKDGNIVPK